MKFLRFAGAILAIALSTYLPFESAYADDGCTAAPCLNGGVCSLVGDYRFSCSCASGFLGLTCEYAAAGDEEITVEHSDDYGGGGSIGWWATLAPDESGRGQTFLTSKGGLLEKVSFPLFVFPEAVSRPEGLIVEFWAVDSEGLPIGSPLASHTLPGSGFVAESQNLVTADFSADRIELKPNTHYAFTARVLHKSTVRDYGLYAVDFGENGADSYTDGFMMRLSSGSWQENSVDMMKFQVTVLAPLYEDSFESQP
jgi:hypothetical protein